MPAISDISLNDGAASPVAHTFGVVSATNAKGEWAERSSGKLNGYFRLYHEVKEPVGPKGAYRIAIGLQVPIIETVGGVQVVTRYSSLLCTLNFAQDSTAAERKDLHAYLANFLGVAAVKTASEKVEPFY